MTSDKTKENHNDFFQNEESPFDEINNLKTGKAGGKITKVKIIISDETENSKFQKVKIFLSNFYNSKLEKFCLFINILSFLLYGISLQSGGEDATEVTLLKGMQFYVMIAVFDIFASFFLSLYFSIIIFTMDHYFHLIYVLPIYCIYFLIFTGTNVDNHGFYNMIGFICFLIIFIPFLLILFFLYYFLKNKKYKNFLITVLLIILSLIIIEEAKPKYSCKDWDLGLNNTIIDNNQLIYPCVIQHPREGKCLLNGLNGVFDLSKKYRPSCEAYKVRKDEYKTFIKNIGKHYKYKSSFNYFGYPITTQEKYDMKNATSLEKYMKKINNDTIRMDLFNEDYYANELEPEVTLKFDEDNMGKISINLKPNKTLSKIRAEISKEKKSLYNNILIIYIDAVSRNHFKRKLTKLTKIIEPYMKYNRNEKEKKYTSFQFLKYHTLQALTYPNIKAMFYGIPVSENKGINLVKYFKEQGYITGHTGTTCGREIFSVNRLSGQNLDFNSWDHENIAMFCDPNFFSAGYPLSKGVASLLKRCLYGNYAFDYMIEYTKQFWESYPNNKKLFRIHFNEGHEGTMELIKYLENPLYDFVKYFFDKNLLNDTVIFFVSDHGNHMLGPWKIINPDDFRIESTLGTLYIIVPNNGFLYNTSLYDNLFNNQQTFVTPYDVHDTLIHIAFGNFSQFENYFSDYEKKRLGFSMKGDSLFQKLNVKDRFCESLKFNYTIARSDCKCDLVS